MLNSADFWLVLACSVPVFWLLPRPARFAFLGLASMGYLITLSGASVAMLGVWLLVFYFAAPYTRPGHPRHAVVLASLILAIVAFFSAFKYLPGLIGGVLGDGVTARVAVPLGISYYTFKLIHYATEVARGNVPERSLAQFFSYMFLFPIFTAGPIERFDNYLRSQDERWRLDTTVEGLSRIVHGLVKKFVLAWWLAEHVFDGQVGAAAMGERIAEASPLGVLGYLAATYLYIYFDFSAYTDVALGASRLFGIRVVENFHFPIVADNIREYWRRWHMSLSSWCQVHVYMPLLGLYRKPLVSLYATFFVMGLWHAGTLNRLAWGVYHATGVAVYTAWSRFRKRRGLALPRWVELPVAVVLTQVFVCGSMAFLILEDHGDLRDSLRVLGRLAGLGG